MSFKFLSPNCHVPLFQPPPAQYDHSVDERDHTVEQWKELIFDEVKAYEARAENQIYPSGTNTTSPPSSASGSMLDPSQANGATAAPAGN